VFADHIQRETVCHFIMKHLYSQPYVALIIYNQRKHVDKSVSLCHKPLDDKAIGTQFIYAPYILEELQDDIDPIAGFYVESIMQNKIKAM